MSIIYNVPLGSNIGQFSISCCILDILLSILVISFLLFIGVDIFKEFLI
jgi:hypothetical protein